MLDSRSDYDKYSVLMSVYAKEKPEYLRRSIESMLQQTVPPDQFVLVEDGQLTSELCEQIEFFIHKYPTIFDVIAIKNNVGLGLALDEGIKKCRNELVARMDSDDIAIPSRCEKELNVFKKQPELAIVSGFVGEFKESPNELISVRTVPEYNDEIIKRMRTRSAFNHPAVMYKKSEVCRCGGYGTLRRKQDHVLFSHMLHSGCKAYNIQEVILLFRADINSVKRKKSWDNCRGYIEAEKLNFTRGECSIFDLAYVTLTQILILILPVGVVEFIIRKLIRTKIG